MFYIYIYIYVYIHITCTTYIYIYIYAGPQAEGAAALPRPLEGGADQGAAQIKKNTNILNC